ncbi:MAG TPA: type II toxin-antitoxin system RelE/ParE family toxin [Chthonomonadales bacterium]|nr:type II toxin-antitoxin system RelE/ParE family toxin [Chthonomonadales bacterium]
MSYSIRIKESAARALAMIEAKERERLVDAIDRLASDPAAGRALKGEFQGLRRVRAGDYRVIDELRETELVVLALRIGNRRDVHR